MIMNVCKICPNGQTDLMVVQCNASNMHGYAYASGYLNVLCELFVNIHFDRMAHYAVNRGQHCYGWWRVGWWRQAKPSLDVYLHLNSFRNMSVTFDNYLVGVLLWYTGGGGWRWCWRGGGVYKITMGYVRKIADRHKKDQNVPNRTTVNGILAFSHNKR